MRKKPSNSEIVNYLDRAKQLLAVGKYDFVPRSKNLLTLARAGLTVADVKSEVFDLDADDYYAGPKSDYDSDRPGDLWEFKKAIDGMRFYVKVKIVRENGEDMLKCISFHEDELVQ